jgi:hypothetical protein
MSNIECLELPRCSLSIISPFEGLNAGSRLSLPPPKKFTKNIRDSASHIVGQEKTPGCHQFVCNLKQEIHSHVGNEIESSESGRWSCPTETKRDHAGQVASLLLCLGDKKMKE